MTAVQQVQWNYKAKYFRLNDSTGTGSKTWTFKISLNVLQ